MNKLSTFVLYNLLEESLEKLKFSNPYSDEFKELVNNHNSICQELYDRGEFDDINNYGQEKIFGE